MRIFGFIVGVFSILCSLALSASFLDLMRRNKHIDFHHDGILLLGICGIALGTILLVWCFEAFKSSR